MKSIRLGDRILPDAAGPHREALFDIRNLKANMHALRPGQELLAHVHHDLDKVFLVCRGQLTIEVEGQHQKLGPEEMVLVPAGATHGASNESDEDAALLVMVARHGWHHAGAAGAIVPQSSDSGDGGNTTGT